MRGKESTVKFESFDGVPLEGTFRAAHGGLRAMCLFVHGITADRHEWGTFDAIAAMLSKRGVCSLRLDYRCHGAAANIPDRDLTLSGVANDIDAAFTSLCGRAGARLPVIVVGASFGAGAAARWAIDRYKAKLDLLVLLYPVLDYEADLVRVNASWREELRATGTVAYGPKALGRPFACEVATGRLIESLEAAAQVTFIFHGQEDSDVPIEESEQARAASDSVHLFAVAGDHGFAAEDDPDLETAASQRNVAAVVRKLSEEMDRIGY